MWFGAGFFSIRRMARRIAPLLISLRGAARKVPNFAQPIILAYETYASAKISRHSVAAWLYGVFIDWPRVSRKLQCCRLLLKVVAKGIVHYACI